MSGCDRIGTEVGFDNGIAEEPLLLGGAILYIDRTRDLGESAKMNNSTSLDNTMKMGRNKEFSWGFHFQLED